MNMIKIKPDSKAEALFDMYAAHAMSAIIGKFVIYPLTADEQSEIVKSSLDIAAIMVNQREGYLTYEAE